MQKIRLGILSAISAVAAISSGAGAVPAAVVALGAAAVGTAGFAIYRSFSPTDTAAAFDFFSSCWTCRIFSGTTGALSDSAGVIYANLGEFVALLAIVLTPLFMAWKVLGGYLSAEPNTDAFKLGGGMGLHLVKLAFVSMLLLFPLPQLISKTAVEPVMNIALSFQDAFGEANTPGSTRMDACLVASIAIENPENNKGIFGSGFKNKMRCSIAGLHEFTATGMTAGWLLANSAFDAKNMYKAAGMVPIFPNMGMLIMGFLLLAVYFWIIMPIALAFLEFVVKFAIDMIFLPLTLLTWLFKGNPLWDTKDEDMMSIITDIVKLAAGLGLIVVFLGFALMMTGYALSGETMANMGAAFMANNPDLVLNNDSAALSLLFVGIFIAMFMTMMTELIKKLVDGANIPQDILKQLGDNSAKLYAAWKKFGKKKEAGAKAP
ncbi:MAG: hypothetical protein LBG89_00385 [Rickettsiales bacterium]|jgi:hypothetical protein|nr:hypothetical protein [Rickettsiales bacterium]